MFQNKYSSEQKKTPNSKKDLFTILKTFQFCFALMSTRRQFGKIDCSSVCKTLF